MTASQMFLRQGKRTQVVFQKIQAKKEQRPVLSTHSWKSFVFCHDPLCLGGWLWLWVFSLVSFCVVLQVHGSFPCSFLVLAFCFSNNFQRMHPRSFQVPPQFLSKFVRWHFQLKNIRTNFLSFIYVFFFRWNFGCDFGVPYSVIANNWKCPRHKRPVVHVSSPSSFFWT